MRSRHFAYASQAGTGEAGSAVLTRDGELIGLHLGGWNHRVSPPPPPGTTAAADAAWKTRDRLVAMDLEHADAETVTSAVALSRSVSIGGYAIALTPGVIQTLAGADCSATSREDSVEPVASAPAAATTSAANTPCRRSPRKRASSHAHSHQVEGT